MANYIDAQELHEETKTSQEQGRATEPLGELFLLLVTNVGRLFRTDDEQESSAILVLLRSFHRIDVALPPHSTFAYFTTTVRNSFIHADIERRRRARRCVSFSVIDTNEDRKYSADFSSDFSKEFRVNMRADWKSKEPQPNQGQADKKERGSPQRIGKVHGSGRYVDKGQRQSDAKK